MGKKIYLNLPLYHSPVIKAGCFPAGNISDFRTYLDTSAYSYVYAAGGFARKMSEVRPVDPEENMALDSQTLAYRDYGQNNIFEEIDSVYCNSLENITINFKVSNVTGWKNSDLYQAVINNPTYFSNFRLNIQVTAYYRDATGNDTTSYTNTGTITTYIDALENADNPMNIVPSQLIFTGKKTMSNTDKIYLSSISVDPSQPISLSVGNATVSTADSISFLRNIEEYLSVGNLQCRRRVCTKTSFTIPTKRSEFVDTTLGTFYAPIYSKELLNDKIMYLTNFSIGIPEQLTLLNPNGTEMNAELSMFNNHNYLPQFQEYSSPGHTFNIRRLNSNLTYNTNLVNPDSNSFANRNTQAYIFNYDETDSLESNYQGTPGTVFETVQKILLDYTLFRVYFYGSDGEVKNINISLRNFIEKGIDLTNLSIENIRSCEFILYLPSLDYIASQDTTSRPEQLHLTAYLNIYSAVNIQFDVSLQTALNNQGLHIGTNRVKRMFIDKNEILYYIADTPEAESYTIPKGTYYCRSGYTTESLFDALELQTCPECGGTGSSYETITCPTCQGSKYVPEKTLCPECLGDGYGDTAAKCPICNGKGYNWSCNACGTNVDNGSGSLSTTYCPKCGADVTNINGAVELMCTNCNGLGRVGGTCSLCNGEGYTYPSVKCTDCKGTGTTSSLVTCGNCRGVGASGTDLNMTANGSDSIIVASDIKVSNHVFQIFCTHMNVDV